MSASTSGHQRLRKSPQQNRSRQMVDRIVAAGREVLMRHGYESATTNRIAEAAGISPGSLYQYFSNKEAVLEAVIDDYSSEVADQLTGILTDSIELPFDELVTTAIDQLLVVLDDHREYVRFMARELPRARIDPHVRVMEQRVGELVGAYLQMARPTTRVRPAVSSWLLVRLVEHLCVQYTLEQPEMSRHEFVTELARLVNAHLAPAADTMDP